MTGGELVQRELRRRLPALCACSHATCAPNAGADGLFLSTPIFSDGKTPRARVDLAVPKGRASPRRLFSPTPRPPVRSGPSAVAVGMRRKFDEKNKERRFWAAGPNRARPARSMPTACTDSTTSPADASPSVCEKKKWPHTIQAITT